MDGSYLIEGKTMTGFADVEEDAANAAAGQKVMPWRIEEAARERGANYVKGGLWKSYDGKVLIDTTNQFGRSGPLRLPDGQTAAQVNQGRAPGARLVKAYNTLTAGFQAEAAR